MYRVKIGFIAAAVVLAVVIGTYLGSVIPLSKDADKRVKTAVERASSLVVRVQRLKGFELQGLAEAVAARKEFVEAVQMEDENKRRIAVFDSINQYDKELRKQGRKAHFLGVVGTDSAIIARDLDPNNLYGEKLTFKNVHQALQGKAAIDLWGPKDISWMKNKMMRAAAAPIRADGKILGAVVIAYEVTAADAREERDQFGTHVAYFMDDAVRASSFSMESDSTEDAGLVEALTREALGSATAPGKAVVAKAGTDEEGAVTSTEVTQLNLQGESYLAILGTLPNRLTNSNVGYVVLSSLTAAQKPVAKLRWVFVLIGISMLIIVLGGMFLVARHFVNAEDKLELGVNEIINGNMDQTFDVVEEFEGLANALNVMLSRLLGRPEPGEDGEDSDAMWRADVIVVDELDPAASTPDLVRQLVAEGDEVYYARIHDEYVEARRKAGLPVEGITVENLAQKLRANEALLKAKHKCQMVRFLVNSQAGRVTLKPIRIS